MKINRLIPALTLFGAFVFCGCGALSDTANQDSGGPPPAPPVPVSTATPDPTLLVVPNTVTVNGKTVTLNTMPSGLKYYDVTVGKGAEAKNGDAVSVQYTGSLMNHVVFDSTAMRGHQPFSFVIGQGQVIKGWDLGIPSMRVGGTRILVIPGNLAYGDSPPPGVIKPNATLQFTVKLVSVQ